MHHTLKSSIYKNKRHILVTSGAILIPFLLFLLFSTVTANVTNRFFVDTLVSLGRMFVAYVIAAALGWSFAVLFYKGRRSDIALPIFDVLQSFPAFAALPIAVQYVGASNTVVIAFLVVAIIWPIFFSTLSSLKLVKRDWQEAATVANLKGFAYIRHFLIPVTVPGLVTGSVIGLGDGWEAIIGTEIIAGVKNGTGVYFQQFAGNPTLITFGILGILVLIFGINKLIWLPLLSWSHKRMEE